MTFKIENFGSDSSNVKSIFGGVNYYRYFNKNSDTLTTPGYFPSSLGLEIGDRICVTPSTVTDADSWYIVSSVASGVITVKKIEGFDPARKFLEQFEELPEATAETEGSFAQFIGETGDYTHGYIYECVSTPVYDSTVEFNPASISSTTAACSGSDFADIIAEYGTGDIDTIIKGTLTYDESGDLLVFVGQDDTNTQVCTFQLYTQDYIDAGFTFTGTLQDGDVITFTCDITESLVYSWQQANVQPTE